MVLDPQGRARNESLAGKQRRRRGTVGSDKGRMNQGVEQSKTQDRRSRFRWRRATYAALSGAMLCAMFATTFASGAWNEASIPIGDVIAQDAFISGVVRMHGSDFTLYSGARIQSLGTGLDVNLERGGTVS